MAYSLPITLKPPLKCYLHQLHYLGAIFSDDSNPLPWLFNHYYQISVNKKQPTYLVKWDETDPAFVDEGLFFQYNWRILKEAAEPSIVFTVIRNMLKLGYYCIGNINEKYVPGFGAYNKCDFSHAFMIYSIDEVSQTVHTFGYLSNERIGSLQVSYQDFFTALMKQMTYSPQSIAFNFYKRNPDFEFNCFDPQTFIYGVGDYLSVETDKGICCIYQWLELLEGSETNQQIDLRNPVLFEEYKRLMYERLLYMLKNGHLMNENAIMHYQEIANGFRNVKLLCIKQNMATDSSLISQIISTTQSLLEKERLVLKQLHTDCMACIKN